MQQEELQQLVKRFLNNKATADERERLADWYRKQNIEEIEWLAEVADEEQLLRAEMLAYIQQRISYKGTTPVRRLWTRIAAAASIILCLGFGGYFLLRKTTAPKQVAQVIKNDILPGSNKATLTLSNGKQIVLTGAKNGKLAVQGGITVNKTADGEVIYAANKSESEIPKSEIQYNTMATPRGGKYGLTLSDGSKVYLNAASSIKYPATFTGNERRVEITGEVYFEVMHNPSKPFRVVSNGQMVEDIGTSFNINAYSDEPDTKTTLLGGAVKVSQLTTHNSQLLQPGQQSQVSATRPKIDVISNVDLQNVMAWKEGMFRFDSTPLADIMKQVSRWYDVDVVYKGAALKTKTFFIVSTRFANVSELLYKLEQIGGVKFKIEGKTITVLNN